jgi:hypothetical protein
MHSMFIVKNLIGLISIAETSSINRNRKKMSKTRKNQNFSQKLSNNKVKDTYLTKKLDGQTWATSMIGQKGNIQIWKLCFLKLSVSFVFELTNFTILLEKIRKTIILSLQSLIITERKITWLDTSMTRKSTNWAQSIHFPWDLVVFF